MFTSTKSVGGRRELDVNYSMHTADALKTNSSIKHMLATPVVKTTL